MPNQKFFANCKTKQELKKTFRELAKKYHPDRNKETDTTPIMTAIIAEYESLIKKLPSDHSNDNNTAGMNDEQFKAFISAEMKEIIDNISHLPITIEIIGSWIWVTADYAYKSYLTAYNFKWCPKKKMYSWHAGQFKRYGKTKDIDEIRAIYGSTKVNNKAYTAIA